MTFLGARLCNVRHVRCYVGVRASFFSCVHMIRLLNVLVSVFCCMYCAFSHSRFLFFYFFMFFSAVMRAVLCCAVLCCAVLQWWRLTPYPPSSPPPTPSSAPPPSSLPVLLSPRLAHPLNPTPPLLLPITDIEGRQGVDTYGDDNDGGHGSHVSGSVAGSIYPGWSGPADCPWGVGGAGSEDTELTCVGKCLSPSMMEEFLGNNMFDLDAFCPEV